MKSQKMQKRLQQLWHSARIEPGKSYDLLPSDCRGDGYDVALTARSDESGDYDIGGHLMRVECVVRVGSKKWNEGIPCGYTLACDPSTPYIPEPGERAEVVERVGRTIGAYMHRTLASIAIRKSDGRLRYQGHSPYWIRSTHTYAAHFRSGRSRADEAEYQSELEQLRTIVVQINSFAAPAAVAIAA